MSKLKCSFCAWLFLLILHMTLSAFAGVVQLKTYYPAPFGAYERLRFSPKEMNQETDVCNENTDGLIIYDPLTQRLLFCSQTAGSWLPIAENWIYNDNKDNITDLSTEKAENILNYFKPIIFNYKGQPNKNTKHMGLSIVPAKEKIGKLQLNNFYFQDMIALLIKIVQTQKALNTKQEQKIKYLEDNTQENIADVLEVLDKVQQDVNRNRDEIKSLEDKINNFLP